MILTPAEAHKICNRLARMKAKYRALGIHWETVRIGIDDDASVYVFWEERQGGPYLQNVPCSDFICKLEDGDTIRAAVAEAVDDRGAQACEEVAAALRRENPPLAEAHVFDQLQLRVDLRHHCAEAVEAEQEACIRDACHFCRQGVASAFSPATWDEQLERWIHHDMNYGGFTVCKAADIRARAAASTEAKEEA